MNFIAKMSKALAIALMFWCAGAGCMMVSYARGAMRETDSSDATDLSSMTHMSGSMDAHACCKARRKNSNRSRATQPAPGEFEEFTVPLPAQSVAMSCCPLTTGSIVIARSNSNDEAPLPSNTDSSAFKLLSSNQKPVAVPLRLPNRAESYLLDCAFLI